jgi:hypothetical protein
VYYAWEVLGTSEFGVSHFKPGNAKPTPVLGLCAGSLEMDSEFLYLFDCGEQRLVRLPLL